MGMSRSTLEYAPVKEFDTGLFVARYLQVLAWLSIAGMVLAPVVRGWFYVDASAIFYFWAAWGLKRRSETARKWVLGVGWVLLGLMGLMFLWALIAGTGGMTVSYGAGRVENPKIWQIAAVMVPVVAVVAAPVVVLMSERARRQFNEEPSVAERRAQGHWWS